MTLEEIKEKYPVGSKWQFNGEIFIIKGYHEYDTILGKDIDLIVGNEVYNKFADISTIEKKWVKYE